MIGVILIVLVVVVNGDKERAAAVFFAICIAFGCCLGYGVLRDVYRRIIVKSLS